MAPRSFSRHQWSLKALRAFEVSARLGSFSAAADDLFVTQGAVSKQIKKLEDHLGFDLFHRDGNRAVLSKKGRELADHLGLMFAELENRIEAIASDASDAPCIISCEPTICLKMLIPLVPQIARETGVEVNVLSGGGPPDFQNRWIDFAVRRADFEIGESLFQFPLGPELVGPVLHPSLSYAVGEAPESYTRIHAETRPRAWEHWSRDNVEPSTHRDVRYQRHFLALEAAESGHGIALASVYMAARPISRGLLNAPFGFRPDGTEYVGISRSPFDTDPKKKRIAEWLRQRFEQIRLENGVGENSPHEP